MPPGDSDESQVFVNDYEVPNLPIGERGWGVHLKRSIISTRPHRYYLSLIHISEPTRHYPLSRMPSSA